MLVTTVGNGHLISWETSARCAEHMCQSFLTRGVRKLGHLYTPSCQSLAQCCSGSSDALTLLICPTHGQKDPGGRRTPSDTKTPRLGAGSGAACTEGCGWAQLVRVLLAHAESQEANIDIPQIRHIQYSAGLSPGASKSFVGG